ncbi:D-alanyl-D-alanine carboxypeptidase [Streptomyces sp. NBC_01476]|uniref:D-alanyl-D-alanine carboxypeptidase family protein n=1 Tax=Streptomyces sp. NBC_01476 TaxID=2903881 RepID=UPI002E36F8FC|nr:D-alanyl-D-alanine carboxypeptidase [Streptomyces sp. NBC_01476]
MTGISTRSTAAAVAALAVGCLPVVLAASAVARSGDAGAVAPAPAPATFTWAPSPQAAAATVPAPGSQADPATAAAASPQGTAVPVASPQASLPAAPAAQAHVSLAGGALLGRPGVQVLPRAGTPALPKDLSGLSWIVSDARTGQVLAAKDAHRQLPPASTLKTLFAVTVLPRFPAATTHKVTDEDLAGTGEGSSLVGVQAGRTYTVADLWRGVFLASGNDAVHVLAHMNGSVPLTVSQMQAKAKMLGADDTHVVSPDGYDMPGQVSSAYDLSLFARAGLKNPDFARYADTATSQFPGGYDAKGTFVASFGIRNTNRLLTGADGVTKYPGVIGVKNGYTTNAGNTLIAAATHGDRTLIATVMNPQSGKPQAVYKEAGALLDWGFAAAGRTTAVGTLNAAPPAAPSAGPATVPAAGKPLRAGSARPSAPPAAAWYAGGTVAIALGAALAILAVRRGRPRPARESTEKRTDR